jgi:hypothetical protein
MKRKTKSMVGAVKRSAQKKPVNVGLHSRSCLVCKNEKREEIEAAFIAWQSPARIAEDYGLADRNSIYRHAHALGLFEARRRNVRAALERIIEKSGEIEGVNASAVVSAIQAYAKINAAGEWVDRSETVNMSELFSRMSQQELENYAKTGVFPAWFQAFKGATDTKADGGVNHGK